MGLAARFWATLLAGAVFRAPLIASRRPSGFTRYKAVSVILRHLIPSTY